MAAVRSGGLCVKDLESLGNELQFHSYSTPNRLLLPGTEGRHAELDQESNVQNLHIAGSDKPVRFYNLDVIISVGYRVTPATCRSGRDPCLRAKPSDREKMGE